MHLNRAKSLALLLVAIVIGLGAGFGLLQAGAFRDTQVTFDPPYPATNDAGDQVHSVYVGRIPCAFPKCNMMKFMLVFYQDPATHVPTTYWLGYIGVGDGNNERTVRRGNVKMRTGVKDYPDANVFELDEHTASDFRWYWQVNENILLPLDENLSPKVGNAAWGYMLSRDRTPYGPRTYQL